MRHLIDSTDLSVAEIDRVLNLADDIIRDPAAYAESCRGKILATPVSYTHLTLPTRGAV